MINENIKFNFDEFCDARYDDLQTLFAEKYTDLATSDFYNAPFDNIEFQSFCEELYQKFCDDAGVEAEW